MNLLKSQQRITELMAAFVAQVKGAAAMGHADINHVAETILIPLFAEIYGWEHLENLNDTFGANFPAVDLGDDEARIALQITATPDSEKIKHTLRMFVKHQLYNKYDRLIIYIIMEKQQSYSGSGYDDIVQSTFSFDKDRDIWDYQTILEEISRFQIDRTRRVETILEANFGQKDVPVFGQVYTPQTETVYINLLGVAFPDTLYVAQLNIKNDNPQNGKGSLRRGRGGKRYFKQSSPRENVQKALRQQGLKFSADWTVHEDKIITFHNLNDNTLPITEVIDRGTVEVFTPKEFYSIDESYENVFKSLLRFCLQQKLYREGVSWQSAEKLFIFVDIEGEAVRKEEWFGRKESARVVYERFMKRDKPDEIWYCKHFGFEVQFYRFGDNWYIALKPDWFFSYDGYTKSFYHADDIKWLKRHENNNHFANHIKFLAYFLKRATPADLFGVYYNYPFLSFGEFISFDNAPRLDDKEHLPTKNDSQTPQLALDIEEA